MTTKKRRQHYVWRYYLEAWAIRGSIACLRGGKFFTSKPTNVAVERDFYQLREMTEGDLNILRNLLGQFPVDRQAALGQLIQMFDLPFKLRRGYEAKGKEADHLKDEIEKAFTNLEENLHAEIEGAAKPLLDSLRGKDASFFADADGFASLMHYLSTRYLRTKRMMKAILHDLDQCLEVNAERLWGPLRHILATSMAITFSRDRSSYWLCFLETTADSPFIAGDQPVINTYAVNPSPNERPDKIELYYPVKPTLAVLIGDKNDKPNPGDCTLSASQVTAYNQLIWSMAQEQIYASSEECLQGFASS